MSFRDKVILVTGGTSGIGQATAELLAERGARVVLSGCQATQGNLVLQKIRSTGGEAHYINSDINSEVAVQALIDGVLERYGRLDGAVNNDSIALGADPLHQCTTEDFRAMIDTNVLGVFWCMQYEIKAMLGGSGGSIVNLASMAGLHGIPHAATYSATKHAVIGLTKSAAMEYGPKGIRINAIAPGAIRTAILDYAIKAGTSSVGTETTMRSTERMGKPVDIAHAIAALLESDHATGAVLSVDGGIDCA